MVRCSYVFSFSSCSCDFLAVFYKRAAFIFWHFLAVFLRLLTAAPSGVSQRFFKRCCFSVSHRLLLNPRTGCVRRTTVCLRCLRRFLRLPPFTAALRLLVRPSLRLRHRSKLPLCWTTTLFLRRSHGLLRTRYLLCCRLFESTWGKVLARLRGLSLHPSLHRCRSPCLPPIPASLPCRQVLLSFHRLFQLTAL